MAKITVWSKQHENVWKVLQETGRYTVKREYIIKDLKEHSGLVLDTYEWLVKNGPDYGNKPADVEFPVWVSFRQDATMLPGKRKSDLGTGDRRIPDYQSEFHKMGNDPQLFLYSGRQGG